MPFKRIDYYTPLRDRVITILGDDFAVDPIDHAIPCDVTVDLPEGMGTATVCLEHRRWCMGGRWHAQGEPTAFGVRCFGYSGRGWVEAIAADLRESFVRSIQDDLDEFEQEERDGSRRAGVIARNRELLTRLGEPCENWRDEYPNHFQARLKRRLGKGV